MISERILRSDDKIKILADNTSTTDRANVCPQSKYEKAFNVSKSFVQLFTSFWRKLYKQQQTNKTQQQQTTGLNNNNKPTTLNHTKPQCHPVPKSFNQGFMKAPKTSVTSDVLQNLVTSYIHMCFWHMTLYDVIVSHDLIKALSCTALGVHSTRTYPL